MAKRERTRLEKLVRVLAALLLIVLLIIAGYSSFRNETWLPENALATVLAPVNSFFSGATDYVVDYLAMLKLRGNLEAEYNKLRALNEQLMYRALFAEDLQRRMDYLLELLGEYNASIPMNPLYARVVEREPGNWFSSFILNKGTNDGVKANMAVITHTGMVGNVVEVFANTCKVITIIDTNFSIGGVIVSTSYQGVVGGALGYEGSPLCRMYYVPKSAVPRPGDTVVTSGVGLPFPKGLVLGTVRESTRALEDNKDYIVIEPAADFERIEDVLILRYEPTIEIRPEGEEVEQREIVAPPTPRPQPTIQDLSNMTQPPLPNAPGRATPTPGPEANQTPPPTETLVPTEALPPDDGQQPG